MVSFELHPASSPSQALPSSSPPQAGHLPPSDGTEASCQHKNVTFRRISSPDCGSMESIREQSPLLQPRTSEEEADLNVLSPPSDDDWLGDEDEETKSSWYLLLLTLSGTGLQIAWSVETSNGSPFLLSLGLSKSLLALVWIAGPLSGTLVQPYVGLKSDNCRISWGKRRPFILGGALATILSLMILAWTKELVGGFLGLLGADSESRGVKNCIILWAVVFVYVLDFAINVIQAAVRAYIVDCTPTHQQEAANAWIMRTTGFGNILGYLSGYMELPQSLPFLGDSQFKVMCAIASFAMAITVLISCSTVHERDPRREGMPNEQGGLMNFFKSVVHSIRTLPPQIRRVCEVQFFAWMGWFPFLFYITTYIGEIFVEPYFEANPTMTESEIDQTWETATRIGTFALLIFALTTFASSIILPFVIPPTFKPPPPSTSTPMTPAIPAPVSGPNHFTRKPLKRRNRTLPNRLISSLRTLQIRRLTLRRAWLLSHLMFAALMWLTIFVKTTKTATILVALVGTPWALTSWAPFALIASEISRRDAMQRGILRSTTFRSSSLLVSSSDEEDEVDQAGVILGIHNVAIAAPQVIATLVSSVIFKLLQKPRGSTGDDSVAWVLRFGGCCAIVAAVLTRRIGEEEGEILGRRAD